MHGHTFPLQGKVTIRSHHGRYLCGEPGQDKWRVIADREHPKDWETWVVVPFGDKVAFMSHHGRYLCAEQDGRVIGDRTEPKDWEKFTWVQVSPGVFNLRSHHGKYLCAEDHRDHWRVVCDRSNASTWEQWTIHPAGGAGGFPVNTRVNLLSFHGKYLCAEPSGMVVANRGEAKEWEKFYVVQVGHKVAFQSHHGKFLCAEQNGTLVCNRDSPREWESFEPIPLAPHTFALRSHHGTFICAEQNGTAVVNRREAKDWERWIVRTA
jgi:hypothetical protein